MSNKNANLIIRGNTVIDEDQFEDFDLDMLESQLQNDLDIKLSEFEFLKEEKEKIGSADSLGTTVMNTVWEQFLNQMSATAGEDFVKDNRGLRLDLSKDAHIQTTENFASGKIATHNDKIDYQERYDNYMSNFEKDANGNVKTHKDRTGKEVATLAKGARKKYDKDRPTGSASKGTDMDHTVSAGEIMRDTSAGAHMSEKEKIKFANSEANLNEMDSSKNRSKGDKSMDDWLDNPNSNGQKPDEIFNISEKEKKELRKKDEEARKEFEKQKAEGEKKSIETGKQSRKEEAFRIGGKALRAVFMTLLAELIKEIFGKLVLWFKSAHKNIKSLIEYIKNAVKSFVSKIKIHLLNAGNSAVGTIAQAIFGPVVSTIKKVFTLLKQGWKSLKEAIKFLKSPESKKLPFDLRMLEVGKIIVAGVSAVGAIVLGEVIEKGLMTIPVFAFEIPIIGSLASVVGLFMGAIVSGVIGAIAINLINKKIAEKQKKEIMSTQITSGNEVLNLQHQVILVNDVKLERDKMNIASSIRNRHDMAANDIKESIKNIAKNCEEDVSLQDTFNDIDDLLSQLEGY